MKSYKQTEIIILYVLWILMISTYLIAKGNNYILSTENYIGRIALIIGTIIIIFKSKKSVDVFLILLLLGTFGLCSYSYFIDVKISFSLKLLKPLSINFELKSLILLIILTVKKKSKVGIFYKKYFKKSEEEKELTKLNMVNRFKLKFEKLSDKEIEQKLNQNLVEEAKVALNQLKEERNNN